MVGITSGKLALELSLLPERRPPLSVMLRVDAAAMGCATAGGTWSRVGLAPTPRHAEFVHASLRLDHPLHEAYVLGLGHQPFIIVGADAQVDVVAILP